MIFFPSLGIAVLGMLWRNGTASVAWPIEVTFISEVLPQRARAGVLEHDSANLPDDAKCRKVDKRDV